MADLTPKEVLHVASLARLSLSDQEVETFTSQLGSILDFFASLSKLDTAGVEPTSHVIEVKNRFREDKVIPSTPREEITANGPQVSEGQYQVPRIITEGD